ncbi:lipocalin-like domain-containing protein [Aureimonas phyllosphaerae]|uniref:Putative secreted hydrolase n=1 Tax=Aureimonas phyllosphaerae TaxID=1166078 RepID=A0A7W6BSC3_9HYPH|nr:lipocalin-like domain-containing protein [Aureimonas phyllosphaerae]MBB3937159.1 putative secreted hydrolase [Aureimonas phyllosphaerae]MBB3961204.1 putative secreted hydrolase [Aureimonas phyllosphaerae]SFF52350.1 Predicted secreted hydrolase [Aureimonas phyllosphaerae]
MRVALAFLLSLAVLVLPARAQEYPVVRPGVSLSFPADHGAHPDFRTEWWYVTGWLRTGTGEELGFQVTFFRTRPSIDPANPSRFAPAQVLFAHAAISDPAVGKLLHGERSAREGFGLAGAATGNADVSIRDWHIRREADGRWTTTVRTPNFSYDLAFRPTQAEFLQGDDGYSRKGTREGEASYYYSLAHLEVSGTLARAGGVEQVTGEAWLDREWSSQYLAPEASGWDWTGLNFDDCSALVAFRMRGREVDTVYAGGSWRRPDGTIVRLGPGDVRFEPVRRWRSERTGATYPVEQVLVVRLPEGERRLPLQPLFDDQELDGRAGGLPVYWEGAVRTEGGRGYLELTGYTSPLSL